MKRKMVKVFAVLAAAGVMLSGTVNVRAEGSYITKPGDNLQKIAREVYGSAEKWNVIYEANKDQIKNPNKIWANQSLILPGAESGSTDVSDSVSDETTNTSASDVTVDASTLLQSVYQYMEAQDYGAMRVVDGSDEAEAYVNAMADDRAVYIPDGSLTGKGAGIYKCDRGYYFYYGDYVDGVRCGNGSSFISYSDAIRIFTGAWDNDAPNGQGTDSIIYDDEVNSFGDFRHDVYTYSGILKDGLWNGTVNIAYQEYLDGNPWWGYDKMTFVADNGVATEDKTDEYLSHVRWMWEEQDLYDSEEDFLWEGRIVFAFGGEEQEGGAYYDDARVALYCVPGSHLGVYGWAD